MKNELCNHLSVCFLSLLIGISKKNSFINLNTATLFLLSEDILCVLGYLPHFQTIIQIVLDQLSSINIGFAPALILLIGIYSSSLFF